MAVSRLLDNDRGVLGHVGCVWLRWRSTSANERPTDEGRFLRGIQLVTTR